MQLLLIKTMSPLDEPKLSANEKRRVGDVVVVRPDTHVFSDNEKKVFDVVQVPDATPVPKRTKIAPYGEWDFGPKQFAWRDESGVWRKLEERPRFRLRYEGGLVLDNCSARVVNTTAVLIPTKDVPVAAASLPTILGGGR